MKIAVLDITSRNAVQYNPSLCSQLGAQSDKVNSVYLLSLSDYGDQKNYKFIKLCRLIPEKFDGDSSKVKKIIRALEVLLNYLIVCVFVLTKRPDILHIQWLPFLEINSVERFFLKIFKFSSKTTIFLTIHNIYPHRLSIENRVKYRNRFLRVLKYIDGFLVHLQSAKEEFISEYGIPENKVFIAYHGIYKPYGYVPSSKSSGSKFRLVMYGFQTRYKGADILIEALKTLPKDVLSKTETFILGKTDKELYESYKDVLSDLNVTWINRFVSDEYLYQTIGQSDLILLPYRKISQSGVLLLALSYLKPILTSNLPSFKETLDGYSDDMFFESENPRSLGLIITKYVHGGFDINRISEMLATLNKKYSWESTAKSTLEAYSKIKGLG